MVNTLRPRQNGRRFADDIFKCIFLNENIWIQIKISLKFVPKGKIDKIQPLVQIMAWRRPGDKPLSQPMMVSLPTHICGIQPQWVNLNWEADGLPEAMNEWVTHALDTGAWIELGLVAGAGSLAYCHSTSKASSIDWRKLMFLMTEMEYSGFQDQCHACWCPGS